MLTGNALFCAETALQDPTEWRCRNAKNAILRRKKGIISKG